MVFIQSYTMKTVRGILPMFVYTMFTIIPTNLMAEKDLITLKSRLYIASICRLSNYIRWNKSFI